MIILTRFNKDSSSLEFKDDVTWKEILRQTLSAIIYKNDYNTFSGTKNITLTQVKATTTLFT